MIIIRKKVRKNDRDIPENQFMITYYIINITLNYPTNYII